jgi:hypothetical protein
MLICMRKLYYLSLLTLTICLFSADTASAQVFQQINRTLLLQVATIPTLFKQLTIIIAILTILAGLHGFYKGLLDSRSPGMPWKKLSLVLIGSMLLYIGSMALTAEKTIFKKEGSGDGIYWGRTTKELNVFGTSP